MRVKFIKDKEITHETWKDEWNKGQAIIKKGDTFKTGTWGRYKDELSVLTDSNEWICDVDSKEFSDLFQIIV